MLRLVLQVTAVSFVVILVAVFAVLGLIEQINSDQMNDLLAYSATENGQATVFAYDPARGISVPVLFEPSVGDIQLSWAPDGESFVAALSSNTGSRLMEIDRFGKFKRQMYPAVNETTPYFNGFMNYDTARLTFAAVPGNNRIFNVVSVNPTDLTTRWNPLSQAAQMRGFCMTPDESIRYVMHRGRDVELYEYQSQASDVTLLRAWSDEFVMSRLVQFVDADCDRFLMPLTKADALNLEVYLFEADREDFLNISNRPLHNDSNVAISGDGQRVAFTSVNGSGYYVVVSSLDGTEQRIIHNNEALLASLAWSADDEKLAIIYEHNTTYGARLCIVDMASDAVDCGVNAHRIIDVAWRSMKEPAPAN